MAETKVTSIRADEETTSRFKELSEQYPNSAECLKALINAHEMAQAKGILAGQETNINDFQSHLDSIMRGYINALDMTANAENRIRQEFQRQLDSKDYTISDLQNSLRISTEAELTAREQAKTTKIEADERVEQATKEIDSLQKELTSVKKQSSELSESLTAVRSQIVDKQQIIDNLNQQLTNAKAMTEKAESAEARAVKAESELSAVKSELSEAKKLHESDVKELKQQLASHVTSAEQAAQLAEKLAEADKREALANQKEKYIEELDKLRQEIKALTEENFTLKAKISAEKNTKNPIK